MYWLVNAKEPVRQHFEVCPIQLRSLGFPRVMGMIFKLSIDSIDHFLQIYAEIGVHGLEGGPLGVIFQCASFLSRNSENESTTNQTITKRIKHIRKIFNMCSKQNVAKSVLYY